METAQTPGSVQLHGDNRYAKVAYEHWLGSAHARPVTRADQALLKAELWDPLEKEKFFYGSLAILEQLQTLERYLWPSYTPKASDPHVLLIVLLINSKRRLKLPVWTVFENRPEDFTSLFKRILTLSIDTTFPDAVRTQLLLAIIAAFQSLDHRLIRKECASLVSISIWEHLHSENARSHILDAAPAFKKAWRSAVKRYDAADDTAKARLRFERSWLFRLLIDFIGILHRPDSRNEDSLVYCERFLEFLSDLLSQFPTRRYTNILLQDMHIAVIIQSSQMLRDDETGLFKDLFDLLCHFSLFPLEDHTGRQFSALETAELHRQKLAKLQRTALKHFKDKLQLLILSSYGALEQRQELKSHLDALDDEELLRLVDLLGFRVDFPKIPSFHPGRQFFESVLFASYERHKTFHDTVAKVSVLPTEKSLYSPSLLRSKEYDGTRPLAVPKLNLQYLAPADFLWRAFVLFRYESFYGIRNDLEETVKRIQPRRDLAGVTKFHGSSAMALPIHTLAIVEVLPPQVGEDAPAEVTAEIILDVSRVSDHVRRDWENLRPDDVVFLLAIHPKDTPKTNGTSRHHTTHVAPFDLLRTAEIVQVLDDKSRPVRRQQNTDEEDSYRRPRQRRLLVRLDSISYQRDLAAAPKGQVDIYGSLNVVIRRKSRGNNFRSMLATIKRLVLSDTPMPLWLQDVFLGLADPASATYRHMSDALRSVDFRDTFLDWKHLVESLPNVEVRTVKGAKTLHPPFVLETGQSEPGIKTSKKRRRDQEADTNQVAVFVSTYKPPNMGPYPTDVPKTNHVRFTPSQFEAIKSGTNPGLTVIVGPPGTGKTDVATQIISNIYHNFPNERTLLIAHSNQALNQLFQKIVALDIDERHLLRLGHGEGELRLERDVRYSKHGRVESLLERASQLLVEVSRLAASISAPGAHGSSCETAEHFHSVYIKPTWTAYFAKFQSDETSPAQLMEEFPFHAYFYNAPQPLFPSESDKEAILEIVTGCQRHVERIFLELEDIRPFEVLRNSRERSNYLLVKEAKIIAMTSTHAAIHRQEIIDLGFKYDNVIMEEAAQITEVENFIPLAMQKPHGDGAALKRIVLCGDHLQNSPVIQDQVLREYANLEQSLFLRLVRLGVPTIMLDQQGRARASIAELYKWRYPKLESLPLVLSSPEFQTANAGLQFEYQFIDVQDYKGRGEAEPSPHFIQNLGEAEYAVALYMYMRLLGYPSSKISILTTYAGQRALIRDVLAHRCAKNKLFGLPRIVATVDKYQGEQNDYVILSLVRTKAVGYLRDLRRLTVALSRARLGLYIFGRKDVFESCAELAPVLSLLFRRPTKLALAIGETWPTARLASEETEKGSEMEGVEHLGQYVFEMTQAKVQNLQAGREQLAAEAGGAVPLEDEEDDDEDFDMQSAHGPVDGTSVDGVDGGEWDDGDEADATG